jgi:hypothetical protein
LSKVPTKKAQEVFKNYFKNKLTSWEKIWNFSSKTV